MDNYDSFTYNLYHYFTAFDVDVDVIFNNKINLETVKTYDKIVFSPGPGLPNEAGLMMEIISTFKDKIPMLGVCLGFQAIVESFGGKLYNQNQVKHGISEEVCFDTSSKLFNETGDRFQVGLYHSWAAINEEFPKELKITGNSRNNVIMAFEHESLPIAGVQFHPESILSAHGKKIVENFIFSFH